MNRVSTTQGWNSALLNLMSAQQRQLDAQNTMSTQKVATDLKGYGQGAETLTAFNSAQARLQGFIDSGTTLAARLTTQDVALNQVSGAAQDARSTVTQAIANGRGEGLMTALQQEFQQAVDGLNTTHDGRYIFGGGRTDQAPVTATQLSDLTAAPTVGAVFQNDQMIQNSRLDEATTMPTGMLASDLGTNLFNIFKTIQAYDQGPNGPLSGTLNQTQTAFLQSQISALDSAYQQLTDATAQNGALQNRVDSHVKAQKDQQDTLTDLIGKRTDADLPSVLVELTQAQTAVQASAQVLASLKQNSLLNYLSPG